MAMEPESSQSPELAQSGPFLFRGMSLGGPLEELRATFEKKFRMYQNLGDSENAERVSRAHEIARSKLESALSQARVPAGS